MQKNLCVVLSDDLAKRVSAASQVTPSAPVEIDAALFGAISGGRMAPRGTWSVTDGSQEATPSN